MVNYDAMAAMIAAYSSLGHKANEDTTVIDYTLEDNTVIELESE